MSASLYGQGKGSSEPEDMSDEEVVALILRGDREVYAVLVGRYQEGLFRFAVGMVGSADSAADIVQESLVKAYTSIAQCREPARFGAWVHRIVRNRCLDHLKRARTQRGFEGKLDLEPVGPEAEDRLLRGELRQALFSALLELPAAQREAFLMKHLEDRSYEEMSDIANASVSALKMRVKRAREALQSVLARTL